MPPKIPSKAAAKQMRSLRPAAKPGGLAAIPKSEPTLIIPEYNKLLQSEIMKDFSNVPDSIKPKPLIESIAAAIDSISTQIIEDRSNKEITDILSFGIGAISYELEIRFQSFESKKQIIEFEDPGDRMENVLASEERESSHQKNLGVTKNTFNLLKSSLIEQTKKFPLGSREIGSFSKDKAVSNEFATYRTSEIERRFPLYNSKTNKIEIHVESGTEKIIKKRLKNYDNEAYEIRVSTSREIRMNEAVDNPYLKLFPSSSSTISENLTRRVKSRSSFLIGSAKIDLTYVEQTDRNQMGTRYEVEIEFYPEGRPYTSLSNVSKLDIINFIENVLSVAKIIQKSYLFITKDEYSSIISEINRILSNNENSNQDKIFPRYLVQARNLKLADLTLQVKNPGSISEPQIIEGGLLGNTFCTYNELTLDPRNQKKFFFDKTHENKYIDVPFDEFPGANGTSYNVSIKVDGIRKLLYINSTGIWLVMAPNEVNKIISPLPMEFASFIGCIFDGEFVSKDLGKRIEREGFAPEVYSTQYLYFPFDTMAVGPKFQIAEEIVNTSPDDENTRDKIYIPGAVEPSLKLGFVAGIDIQTKPHALRRVIYTKFAEILRAFSSPETKEVLFLFLKAFSNLQVTHDMLEAKVAGYTITNGIKMLYSKLPEMVDNFYQVMGRVFQRRRIGSLPCRDDGLIFTPNHTPYNPYSDKYELNERYLTSHPDICKWKPAEEMTIDLLFERRQGSGTGAVAVSGTDTTAVSSRNLGTDTTAVSSRNLGTDTTAVSGSGNLGTDTTAVSSRNLGTDTTAVSSRNLGTRKESLVARFLTTAISGGNLGITTGSGSAMEEFRGSAINPMPDPSTLELIDFPSNLPSKTIVEISIILNPITKKVLGLKYLRSREDKVYPNRTDIAESNWDWVFNPLSEQTLCGLTMDAVFRYHSVVRKELIKNAINQFQPVSTGFRGRGRAIKIDPELTLLDIGSGQGGDVPKWTRFDVQTKKNIPLFKKLVLVEPEIKYFDELKRRLALFGYLEENYRIVKSGGQDTTAILAAMRELGIFSVDIISAMFSMTFFWRSRTDLEAFARTCKATLRPGGKILFFTLDGMILKEMSYNSHRGVVNNLESNRMEALGASSAATLLNTNGIYSIRLESTASNDLNPLRIRTKIASEVVGEIIEYPVYINDLIKLFQERLKYKGGNVTINRADEELFLSAAERLYSRMYSVGMITMM